MTARLRAFLTWLGLLGTLCWLLLAADAVVIALYGVGCWQDITFTALWAATWVVNLATPRRHRDAR